MVHPLTPRWHALRTEESLSSTKVAAAMGIDPFKSTAKLYRHRIGAEEEVFSDYSRALMDAGVREEPVIRRLVRRVLGSTRWTVVGEPCMFRAAAPHQWLLATPDGFLVDRHNADAAYCIEFKRTTSLPPPSMPRLSHCVQLLCQCVATGASGALICYVSPADGYRFYAFDFTERMRAYFDAEVVPRCTDFLRRVRDREPPLRVADKKLRTETAESFFQRHCRLVASYDGQCYVDRADGRGYDLFI